MADQLLDDHSSVSAQWDRLHKEMVDESVQKQLRETSTDRDYEVYKMTVDPKCSLPCAEIAKQFNTTAGNVYTIVSRMKTKENKLRSRLEKGLF